MSEFFSVLHKVLFAQHIWGVGKVRYINVLNSKNNNYNNNTLSQNKHL